MKKLIVTAIIALAGTPALASDSQADVLAAEGIFLHFDSGSSVEQPGGAVATGNTISDVLAAEGITLHHDTPEDARPRGDIVIGNTIDDLLRAEGMIL